MATIQVSNPISGARRRTARPAAVYEYDFAIDGGAIATIPLRSVNGGPIPSGAVITDTVVDVLTIPTSGGAATAALQIEAAGDVVAAGLISAAPWSTLGRKAGTPVSAATSIKTTAERTPALVVGAAALTAGKVRVTVEYIDPNAG